MNRRATACLALGLLAGCRKEPAPPEITQAGKPASSNAAGAGPADHLAAGELVEGTDKILGLVLPRELKPSWVFEKAGLAQGDVEPELVANYVRAHVVGGKISIGATMTLFEDVRLPADPAHPLRIKIERLRGRCTLEVRDATPPPPGDNEGTDADRWRKLGLAPNGQPLDPMHTR